MFDRVHFPLASWITGILEPGDPAVWSPTSGDNIEITVAVEVSRDRFNTLRKSRGNRVFRPLDSPAWRATILVPGNLVRIRRIVVGLSSAESHHHILVSIAIEVDWMSMLGSHRFRIDDVFVPGSAGRFAGALVPDNLIGNAGAPQQVWFAVSVKVGDGDRAGLCNHLVDFMPSPLATITRLANVFEPVESIAKSPTGSSDIEIAVTIQVRQSDVIRTGDLLRLGDAMQLPLLSNLRRPRILEPADVPLQIVDDHDVDPTVAVDVADCMPLQTNRLVVFTCVLLNERVLETSIAVVPE